MTNILRKPYFLLFFLLLSPSPSFAALVDKIVAIVNNEPILNSEVEDFYRLYELRREIDPFFLLVDGFQTKFIPKDHVIEYLIQEKLIALNFKVSEIEVDEQINSIIRNNNTTREGLEQFIRSKGFGLQDHRNLIRIGKQKEALLNREIRSRVSISDDEVKNKYVNSMSKGKETPNEYSIQMIVISSKNYKSTKYAKETADRAAKAISEGEPFAEVAKRVSDEPFDIGFVAGENLSSELLRHVKELKIGQVSKPVSVGDSYRIIKLNDVASLHNKKFEADKELVREQLAKEEYKRQLALWTTRTKSPAYIKINP